MIVKHIPTQIESLVVKSLHLDRGVINYRNIDVNKQGLKFVMDLAVEGGIVSAPIYIDAFADESFAPDLS